MMAGTLIKGKRIEGRPWLKDDECYTYKKRNEYKKSKFSSSIFSQKMTHKSYETKGLGLRGGGERTNFPV